MTSSSESAATLLVEQVGVTRVLSFNRPERRNAWDDGLRREYMRQLLIADADPQVRAIVVTGVGTAFCSGADMGELVTRADGSDTAFMREVETPLHVRKPLIAAINGAAVGLGLLQALYCDVRFCVPDAKLSTTFARRGFVGEFGIVGLLSSLAGRGHASDLLLSGRVFLGTEARDLSIVNFLAERDELLKEAIAYAEDLGTSCSPGAMATIKRQIREEPQMEFWAGLHHAEDLQLASLETNDVTEGFEAFFEKRTPEYE
jgi:enoyl-CoA hydratase/carnithine racemase